MPGLRDFVYEQFHARNVVSVSANTTLTLDHEYVRATAAINITLPSIASMRGTTTHSKVYFIENASTGYVSVAAATGDTIAGRLSLQLAPNEEVVIYASEGGTDWSIESPYPLPATFRNYSILAVNTNGTTAVNIFGALGSPTDMMITGVFLISLDTTAADITVSNAGNTVCTIAKGATAGALVGATSLTNTAVAKGNSLQVVSSAAGNATVFITFTTQSIV